MPFPLLYVGETKDPFMTTKSQKHLYTKTHYLISCMHTYISIHDAYIVFFRTNLKIPSAFHADTFAMLIRSASSLYAPSQCELHLKPH